MIFVVVVVLLFLSFFNIQKIKWGKEIFAPKWKKISQCAQIVYFLFEMWVDGWVGYSYLVEL